MDVTFFLHQPFYPKLAIQGKSEWECPFLSCDVEKSVVQFPLTEPVIPDVIGPQKGIQPEPESESVPLPHE